MAGMTSIEDIHQFTDRLGSGVDSALVCVVWCGDECGVEQEELDNYLNLAARYRSSIRGGD
jgi:hypothetical protein